MTETTRTKKKFVRKQAKRYEHVTFELDFAEGTFSLPSFKQMPQGVTRKLTTDPNRLYDFIETNAEDGAEVVEFLDDLDSEETAAFVEAWANASGVEAGK